ncbi:TPA: hypothetical protein DEF17_07095 [bacterium]|nr:hypothetical protein [bacterium]
MIIRTPKRSRGDMMIALNKERIIVIAIALFSLEIITLLIGFAVGRWFFPSPPVTTEIVEVPQSIEETPAKPSQPAESNLPSTSSEKVIPIQPTVTSTKPAPPPSPHTNQISSLNPQKHYAIVAGSIPIGDTPALARAEAERKLNALKVKGFKNARIEEVEIPNKGKFFRIIAMEADYPSATVAQNDIKAMIRRGELASAFLLEVKK